jgi:hypothetical protein
MSGMPTTNENADELRFTPCMFLSISKDILIAGNQIYEVRPLIPPPHFIPQRGFIPKPFLA